MSLVLTREALSNQIADDLATRNTNAGLIEGAVDGAVVRIDTAESDIATLNALKLDTALTITVGTGGDCATINEALAYATTRYPVYVSASIQPRVTISLLTGFVMAEQVIVDGQDLSWITISSVDAEVVITRSALTTANDEGEYPAFNAKNGGFLPIIGALFNMDTSGTATLRHGLMAYRNSQAIIHSGCGFKNCGGHGIFAYKSSRIDAGGAIATGAGVTGAVAERNSTIDIRDGDVSGAGVNGVVSWMGSTVLAYSANARVGASDAATDFKVGMGSILIKLTATGGVSQTQNVITGDGIIFG